MTSCCPTETKPQEQPKKIPCPSCGVTGKRVQIKTLLHHLKTPWIFDLEHDVFFFCTEPDCEIVYFSNSGKTFLKSDVRIDIGIKSTNQESLICYCFGVDKAAAYKEAAVKDFVIAQTKLKNCACETANPSGRCCLKDFPD